MSTVEAVCELYEFVISESPTLQQTHKTLTPFFELRARKLGKKYDVKFRLFSEFERFVPISLLPARYAELFACLVESNKRALGFASIRRIAADSHEIEFTDFVFNSEIMWQK